MKVIFLSIFNCEVLASNVGSASILKGIYCRTEQEQDQAGAGPSRKGDGALRRGGRMDRREKGPSRRTEQDWMIKESWEFIITDIINTAYLTQHLFQVHTISHTTPESTCHHAHPHVTVHTDKHHHHHHHHRNTRGVQ